MVTKRKIRTTVKILISVEKKRNIGPTLKKMKKMNKFGLKVRIKNMLQLIKQMKKI